MTEGSQYLSFMGTNVHFTVTQPETALKHRVLLLSSPLINTFHWRKLLPELKQLGCLTVAVDLPGFGRSDCDLSVPQNVDMHANIVWGILDSVDRETDQPLSLWHLAAHGNAASTIYRMGARCPDSVKSQIYISPTFALKLPGTEQERTSRWLDAALHSEQRFRSMIERYSAYPMDDYIIDRMRKPLLRPGAKENLLRMLKHSALTPSTHADFCPTIALWGGRDELMDGDNVAALHALLPGAETHVLRSAGHFPMETHSKAMRDYLRGWIRYNES